MLSTYFVMVKISYINTLLDYINNMLISWILKTFN